MARNKSKQRTPARADRANGGRSSSRTLSAFFGAYLEQSRVPLAALLFLLPLLVAYEAVVFIAMRSPSGLVVPDAHRWILTLSDAFGLGAAGLVLPGVLVVVVLLAWHAAERKPWRTEPTTIGLMWSESIVLAIPLLVFSQAVLRIGAPMAAGVSFDSLPIASRISISVGAGIYEELLFRLGMIGILLVVLEDLMKVARPRATACAVALSALAFMAYHPLRDAGGAIVAGRVVFFLAAGVYFGVLFVARGFGIAVGAHAFYDILSTLFSALGSYGAAEQSTLPP